MIIRHQTRDGCISVIVASLLVTASVAFCPVPTAIPCSDSSLLSLSRKNAISSSYRFSFYHQRNPLAFTLKARKRSAAVDDDNVSLDDLALDGTADDLMGIGPDDNDIAAVADDDDEDDEDEDEDIDGGSSSKAQDNAASDYDAVVHMNADIEIEEEDDDEDDDFDLEGLDEEDDDDEFYEEDDESEEKQYEDPSREQLEMLAQENAEENALLDIEKLDRKALNEELETDTTALYELAGDYGGERPDASETSPFYMAEDEIDDGRNWNYTALLLSAIKRNPDMPFARPDWFDKARVEMGLPEVDLMKEQYAMEFTSADVEGADVSLVEDFYNLRGKELPAEDDVMSEGYQLTQEEREFYMARIKIADEEEVDDSLEARWQAWFEEVYDEEQLEEQFKLINQDEENMREDYHWHQRYRHLEERSRNPGLNAKLVIAVKGERSDLKKCEMVTQRMKAEFGDDLYVETQIFPEANIEDYLFEVWIVAYEDELLFSRRKHYYDQEWPGPDDFRSEDLESLVDEVRFHLSDDAKNGFLFT